jgi:hypothetical protein
MASTTSPEETLSIYKTAMGDRLGTIYYAIYCEVVFLYARWGQYRDLFAAGKETIDLLNRHGPFLFKVLQDSLWEQTLLHVARLTDPPRSRDNENLSIDQLVELIQDEPLKKEANRLALICKEKAKFAREHRNKRIAHRDLGHALKEAPEPLSGVSRAHVEEMLTSLVDLLNLLERHYKNSTSMFKPFGPGGARSLILDLKRLEELQRERGM